MNHTYKKNTYYEWIHMNGVFSKFMIIDLVYNGKSTVNERDCEDFLNIFKKYKILKLNQLVKQIKSGVVFIIPSISLLLAVCFTNLDCETQIRVRSGID